MQEILKEWYKNILGLLKVFVGLKDEWYKGIPKMAKVLTDLSFIKQDNSGTKWSQVSSLKECFNSEIFPLRICIQGSVEMGKTTISHQLVYDWAMEHDGNPLEMFKLVFCIHLRELKGTTAVTHIIDLMINTRVIPSTWTKDELDLLKEYIHNYSEFICVILDGFDEIGKKEQKAVNRIYWEGELPWQKVPIIITTRPEVLRGKETDGFFCIINGFDKDMKKRFIERIFETDQNLLQRATKLFIIRKKMADLTSNPMTLTLLCILLKELKGTLPETYTEITHQTILFMIIREVTRMKGEKLQVRKIRDLPPEQRDHIMDVCEFAYNQLKAELYQFAAFDNENVIPRNHFSTIETLQSETAFAKGEYKFWHKSFQEFLAALYFKENNKGSLTDVDIRLFIKTPDLCQFICGVLGEPALRLVSELMVSKTSRSNGDNAWLACLHEAVECRKQFDPDYGEVANLYQELYRLLDQSNKTKKSISCSGRYLVTLMNLVALKPNHRMWSGIHKVTLDCRQEWEVGSKAAQYISKTSQYRGTSPLIWLLWNIIDGPSIQTRFKMVYDSDTQVLDMTITQSIKEQYMIKVCERLGNKLKSKVLQLAAKCIILESAQMHIDTLASNYIDFSIHVEDVVTADNQNEIESSDEESDQDFDEESYQRGTNQVAETESMVWDISDEGNEANKEQDDPEESMLGANNSGSLESLDNDVSFSDNITVVTNIPETSPVQPVSTTMEAYHASETSSKVSQLQKLSIYCPHKIGDQTLSRLSSSILQGHPDLTHIIIYSPQKHDSDLLKQIAKNQKLQLLALIYHVNDSKYLELKQDVLQYLSCDIEIFAVIQTNQGVELRDVADHELVKHINTTAITSKLPNNVFGTIDDGWRSRYLIDEIMKDLQDNLVENIESTVDLWQKMGK